MFQKKGQNLRSNKSAASVCRSESSTVTPLDGSDSTGKDLFQSLGRSLSLHTAGSPVVTASTRESPTETPRDARDSSGTDSEDSSAKRGCASFASFSRYRIYTTLNHYFLKDLYFALSLQ